MSHAKSVNQTLAEVRSLRWSAVVVAALCLAVAVWLFYLGRPWSYVVGTVLLVMTATSVWVALWVPRKVGTIEELYHDSPLVPAVVAVARPRGMTLLALVDIAKPESGAHHYALVTRDVAAIPGHRARVGERVPSVAVMSDRTSKNKSEVWQMVSPMPISWGTRDQKVIADATAAIAESEWKLLKDKVAMAERISATNDRRMELEARDLPPELR